MEKEKIVLVVAVLIVAFLVGANASAKCAECADSSIDVSQFVTQSENSANISNLLLEKAPIFDATITGKTLGYNSTDLTKQCLRPRWVCAQWGKKCGSRPGPCYPTCCFQCIKYRMVCG